MTLYAEAAYFDGDHCQHLADWHDEKKRLRIQREKNLFARGYSRRVTTSTTSHGLSFCPLDGAAGRERNL